MSTHHHVYTYRNGQKLELLKKKEEIVARSLPEQLLQMGVRYPTQQVSSASSKITLKRHQLDSEMNQLRKKLVVHHAYQLSDGKADFLITDRVVLTFQSPPTPDELSHFLGKYALILKRKYSEKEFLVQLTDHTGMNPVKLVVLITETEKSSIALCEHDLNYQVKTESIELPTDPHYMQQWHLHPHFNHPAVDTRSSANCEGAWKILTHFGDAQVVIGVTDDGCRLDHIDFNSPNKFAQWGYMQGLNLKHQHSINASPSSMYQAGADHGTNCCGVAAAEVDAALTVGAAPNCQLLPIKWESSGPSLFISDDKLYTVLEFVQDKVDILSNSWGGGPHRQYASFVKNKIRALALTGGKRGKGILFLWAAGNENCPIQHQSDYDIPYTDGWMYFNGRWNWVGVETSKSFSNNLAGTPGVMFVGALASNAQRSHYSNYGSFLSITAPSSNLHSYYRMDVPGLGITTTTGESPYVDKEFGGTSSATPLVAGIAGLVISANPNLTALEVISVLQRTASKDLNMNGYSMTPPTSYDGDTSWDISPAPPFDQGTFQDEGFDDGMWSPWFGFGKVDAAAAVKEALSLKGGSDAPNRISKTSAPELQIPDQNTVGITDSMAIEDEGVITSIKIEVDIEHTYIGDLVITLISPDQQSVTLHQRNGGSNHHIQHEFNISNTPQLSDLHSRFVKGTWQLKVEDHAKYDVGTLKSWTLHFDTEQSHQFEKTDSAGIIIPDNVATGIERTMTVDEDGRLVDFEIFIDITHTYIGDLIINLISPQGDLVTLHHQSGSSKDNIIRWYQMSEFQELQKLKGVHIKGEWILRVADTMNIDEGKLNQWILRMKYEES